MGFARGWQSTRVKYRTEGGGVRQLLLQLQIDFILIASTQSFHIYLLVLILLNTKIIIVKEILKFPMTVVVNTRLSVSESYLSPHTPSHPSTLGMNVQVETSKSELKSIKMKPTTEADDLLLPRNFFLTILQLYLKI